MNMNLEKILAQKALFKSQQEKNKKKNIRVSVPLLKKDKKSNRR